MADQDFNIDYVAQLARLKLSDEEKELFGKQLNSVLEFFHKLDEVNVGGIEPTAHSFPLYNVWHEDKAGPTFTQEEALKNAPATKNGEIVVPRVVE